MSDWIFLNKHRIKTPTYRFPQRICSTEAFGFNGFFVFTINGVTVKCMACDQEDWKHVSVSRDDSRKPPPWETMCSVKDLFFEPEDWVVQFHPAKSEYVNYHPGCLHLWRYTGTEFKQPTPPSIMVGPKVRPQ